MPAESQTINETLPSNVRAFRQLRGLEQDKLAQRMQSLGHLWRQGTVSEVERRTRSVTVLELVALTVALGANVAQLLDPRGPERKRGPQLALSERKVRISERTARIFGATETEQKIPWSEVEPLGGPEQSPRPSIAAADEGALICSHETYSEVEWDSERHFLRGIDFVHGDPPLIGDVGPDGGRS